MPSRLLLGLVLALAQRTPYRLLTFMVREFVEFIRSTPLVLQIFFVFYVGPQFGIRLSPWTSGMIAIGLHYSAYLSEVYRGGLDSVPKGQWEACRSLSMSTRDTYFRIIIPQALPPALAGMGNYLVGHLQGYAHAVGHWGGRTDACCQRNRIRTLSVPGTLHDGRADLPCHLAALGRADPDAFEGWVSQEAGNDLMEDLSNFPLSNWTTPTDIPMVRFA